MTEILAKISPRGEVTLEVNGISGTGCKDVTAALEAALGRTVETADTPEMYESPKEQHIYR